MRILFTNNALARRAGTELYVRDLALALRNGGHDIAAYSPRRGDVADELERAGVEVVDDLNRLAGPPDILHGHHHLETMTALLHFPRIPAIFVSHGWVPWHEVPPRHPRIRMHFAVDNPTRERAARQLGIPAGQIGLLPNFVDLTRFKPRPPLPAKPRTALVFSNYASEETQTPYVREACAQTGLALDIVGRNAGTASARPEDLLGRYDVVFAKGRAALEAIAVGCAVIVCDTDTFGVGPMISMQNARQLRTLSGDYQTLFARLDAGRLVKEIQKYNAADAAAVSALAREEVGLDRTVEMLLKTYRSVLTDFTASAQDSVAESRAAAEYVSWLSREFHARDVITERLVLDSAALARERNSFVIRLRQRILGLPVVGPWLHRISIKTHR